jgi:hypothetical protein
LLLAIVAPMAFRTSRIIQDHWKTPLLPDAVSDTMCVESWKVDLTPFKNENVDIRFLNVRTKSI